MSERVITKSMACEEAGTHDHERGSGVPCTVCGDYNPPTNAWKCHCGLVVERHRGQGDQTCDCGQAYNACGQALVSDYRGNPSMWDDEIGDLEGYEMQHGGDY